MLLAVPAIDFQVHNSLFLVGHFHSMILVGVLFGFFFSFFLLVPKIVGFTLNEKLGRYAFWLWESGFVAAFVLYIFSVLWEQQDGSITMIAPLDGNRYLL